MKLTEVTNSLNSMKTPSALGGIGIGSGISDDATKKENNSFSEVLEKSLLDVNQSQVNAYDAMNDIATGKVENLQEAVQKIEEAELSLKLGLEVKNKALGAYKQIMAMQV
jgi:flagellar hook-basal body complex protein FliE